MQNVVSRLTFFLVKMFSFLPLSFLYLLSDVLYFVLFHITGYRKKVVYENLQHSFPNKNEKEVNSIAQSFYKHLSDLIFESIKSFTISKSSIIRRVEIENLDFIHQFRQNHENVIVVFGHYGNWEWLGLSSSAQIQPEVFALYRKIKNQVLNGLIKNNRGRFGLHLIGEKEAYQKVLPALNSGDHWSLIGFIADQSAHPKRAYWIDFLNQKTTFVKGPEIYAKKADCPILYFDLQKVKRGYYKGRFELLAEHPNQFTDGEIIKKFAHRLEQQIQKEPAFWLWSHKRWKHKYVE